MRPIFASGLLSLLTAASAAAQVQVDVRLEKTQYLAGEPMVLFVDVRNVGDEAVGYAPGYGNVRLTVRGVQRRVPPNIYGCQYGSGNVMGGSSGGPDHPPMLPPGQSTSFTYLLQQYDLKPGRYELTAAGKAGVVWKYYGGPRSGNDPPPPPPKHKETDPVAGAEFERTVTFTVTATTEDELRAVLSPLVADADLVPAGDGSKMVKRLEARAALIESAPPFLVSVIARFAAEDSTTTARQSRRLAGWRRPRAGHT